MRCSSSPLFFFWGKEMSQWWSLQHRISQQTPDNHSGASYYRGRQQLQNNRTFPSFHTGFYSSYTLLEHLTIFLWDHKEHRFGSVFQIIRSKGIWVHIRTKQGAHLDLPGDRRSLSCWHLFWFSLIEDEQQRLHPKGRQDQSTAEECSEQHYTWPAEVTATQLEQMVFLVPWLLLWTYFSSLEFRLSLLRLSGKMTDATPKSDQEFQRKTAPIDKRKRWSRHPSCTKQGTYASVSRRGQIQLQNLRT